ncbi:hypothetical protein Salat_1567300 [Sesamum alatum]|uniref:Uncharacterized protein n=1 Tax=Sesamum alatum TaxID=300844 RepID=A0AAE2CMU7_9LAMI|nr:hypothetical protein Salat_1567300 [Sesamum alatum]
MRVITNEDVHVMFDTNKKKKLIELYVENGNDETSENSSTEEIEGEGDSDEEKGGDGGNGDDAFGCSDENDVGLSDYESDNHCEAKHSSDDELFNDPLYKEFYDTMDGLVDEIIGTANASCGVSSGGLLDHAAYRGSMRNRAI